MADEQALRLLEDQRGQQLNALLEKMYSKTDSGAFCCLICKNDSYSIAISGESSPRVNLYPGSKYYDALVVVCENCGFAHTFILSILERNSK
ncbi:MULTISPECIES: hypothetical protein [Acetobacter]|uniref:hypothetical protein n=1 Tax=Acetobacter TaxID=434 RepID=UPI000F50F04F|nr:MULTISPECIES: hypothetical protein [Acetobacter]KAA8395636.1 hypothetical protein FKW19_10070 [Acetobacter sp. DmW_125128]KAA8396692.1 hypothetical protein FKW22_05735 [Acetobacter sp. DmW_125124]KAA8400436.1 hypothetical protein FKW20_02125 [Acetobacter sp. DmW_125127]KAA8402948.1 hypothetical protein FKW24_12655 [Acetobacter sp. DmW_125134]KAA8404587.1 hypothetical protein FKW32_08495 [Acetobacter sp. DmW_125132]